MTTKGVSRQSRNGVGGFMLELPAKIAAAEARGQPVIVEYAPGELTLAHQRLFATLGCLVRFVDRSQHGAA